MTALNVIQQEEAAYLLTDTAWYDEDGVVTRIFPKVTELATLPVAIGSMGTAGLDHSYLIAFLERLRPRSEDDVLTAIPELLRQHKAFADRTWPGEYHCWNLGIVIFSSKRGAPEAYVCGTDRYVTGPNIEPFKVQSIWSSICGMAGSADDPEAAANALTASDALGRPVTLRDSGSFDPRSDGLKLLEAQRRRKCPAPGRTVPHHIVGGHALLTTANCYGVRTEVLKQWPDRIGERIAA